MTQNMTQTWIQQDKLALSQLTCKRAANFVKECSIETQPLTALLVNSLLTTSSSCNHVGNPISISDQDIHFHFLIIV